LQRPRTPTMGSVASPQSRGGCDVYLCVRICCRPCRCCLWGLLGELNRFVCMSEGAGGSWEFTIAGRGRLGLCFFSIIILSFRIRCLTFCLVMNLCLLWYVHPILLLFELQIKYLIWPMPVE
jgi:hypothetical protein